MATTQYEYHSKRCLLCGQTKKVRGGFDLSPKTNRPYPRCRLCRASNINQLSPSQKQFRNYYENKRRCIECQMRFTASTLHQKTCGIPCEKEWEAKRAATPRSPSKKIRTQDGLTVLVDANDYDWLIQFQWSARGGKRIKYAYTSLPFHGKTIVVKMEHLIMEVPTGFVCDHINHSGMDDRKKNLRICTHRQNMWNSRPSKTSSSKFKGVSWSKEHKRWRAYARPSHKYIHLGEFGDEVDAAKAYDAKAKELYGEFACLNFPPNEKAEEVA